VDADPAPASGGIFLIFRNAGSRCGGRVDHGYSFFYRRLLLDPAEPPSAVLNVPADDKRVFLFLFIMALTPEKFLRRVIEEEPQTFEGGIAKKLLRTLEEEALYEDPDKIFETHRTALLNELEALSSLQSQFLREEYEEYRGAAKDNEE
jgi:hypothetical protein